MLTLSYTITEDDFLKYHYYMCWLQPAKKKKRLLYYILTPLTAFAIMCGINSLMDNGSPNSFSLSVIATLLVAFTFLMPNRMKASFNSSAKKVLAKSGPDTILTHYDLVVSEEGIAGKTKVKEIKFLWAAFNKSVMVNDCYYLYLNINQALVIPVRAFTTEQEKKEFETLLSQYLPLDSEYPFQK